MSGAQTTVLHHSLEVVVDRPIIGQRLNHRAGAKWRKTASVHPRDGEKLFFMPIVSLHRQEG